MKAGCGKCGAGWGGYKTSHCAGCHLTFQSVAGFDAHRTGNHYHGGRRCLTADEMVEAGFEPNQHGYLRVPGTERFDSE